MKNIGIFYGSDTGNTEKVAKKIYKNISQYHPKIFDISNINIKNMENFDILFLGIPTWYYGELQCDWAEYLPIIKNMNLKNKIFALFGCGDQEDYSEYFCDALGIMYKILIQKKLKCMGKWPIKKYTYDSSKAQYNTTHFVGLIIDEDRQPELTDERIVEWIKIIKLDFQKISRKPLL